MSAKTALVVDDSKSARFAMRKYLESFGYQVDTAECAEDAYIYLRKKQPEVLFIDHIMPGSDGFDAIRSLKQNPQTAGLPIVLCSSNEGEDFLRQARGCGASEVLQKPPSPEQIREVLDSVRRQQGLAATPLNPAHAASVPLPVSVPAAASKVQPIRQPEIAIEQAVMKNLREAMPAAPAAAPAAAPIQLSRPAPPETPAPRLDELREAMEARMRKITQDLFVQLAEAKANLAHLDAAVHAQRDEQQLRGVARDCARELIEPRIEEVSRQLDALIAQLRGDFDELMRAQNQRIDQLAQGLRQMVVEEARAASERVVMNAGARISEQIAESILRVLKPVAVQA